MKNTIVKIFALFVFVAIVSTSCNKDFLELDPPTSVVPDVALGTEADLLVALRGTYAGLRAVDAFGRTLPVIGDVYADNAYQSTQNTNRYTLFNTQALTVNDANVLGIWTSLYTVILRANNIINAPVVSNPNVDQYKGEAYAIRALCYFYLVRWYAKPFTDNPSGLGVPIVTIQNPDLTPTRNTITEVYTLINADLDNAYRLMTKFTNSSQFSKYAAKALQAKVYLTMGDNVKAKAAAVDVISASGFTVVTAAAHAAYWADPAIRTDKVETMFEVSSDAVNNLAFDALSYLYSQAGNYGDFLVATPLFTSFETSDVRRALYPEGFRPAGNPVIFIAKYPSILTDRSDTKLVRLSEVYLIAAEASLPGNEADALTFVNFITSRRTASPITSTGAQLFEDIITERRKELALEGDRYLDLQRLKRTVSRSNNFPATARTLLFNDPKRLLPIPQSELDANPEIRPQQNPGW